MLRAVPHAVNVLYAEALPLVSNESLSGYVALRVSGAKKPARMIAEFYESDPEAEAEAEPRVTEFYPRAPGNI